MSNSANINLETSLAKITGSATAIISITSYTPLINGHRLLVYNNTIWGFNATFYGNTIPSQQAVEFIYTISTWKATSGMDVSIKNW